MLKQLIPVAGLMLAQLLASGGADAQQAAAAKSPEAEKIEKEIRAQADAFVAAFKKRDAAAIAAQWTPDGVYINEEGQSYEGRKAIQSEYEAFFKDCPDDLEMRIKVDSVRLINANTAIEEGQAAMTPQPAGESRVMSRYTAVHVNQDGGWLCAEVRDTLVGVPPDAGELQDLGWLVGTWGASKNDVSIVIQGRWIANNRFLFRTHTVTESGKATVGGTEVIGVDPSTGRITSWSFNNDGSHAVGVLTPMDGSWAVESFGVMEDGTETTATYILSRTDDDTMTWKSVDRMIGDATLPDMPEVVLKRKK